MFEVGKLYKDVSGNTWEVLSLEDNGDFNVYNEIFSGTLTFSPSGVCYGIEEHNLLVVEPETSNESGTLMKSSDGSVVMLKIGARYKDVSGNTWQVLRRDSVGDFRVTCMLGGVVGANMTFSPTGKCYGWSSYKLLTDTEASTEAEAPGLVKSSGGPTAYYDYDPAWVTHNDYLEAKAPQWGVHSWHLSNISKVLTRWGCKDGASITYDAKKGLYSFCRVFAVIAGKGALRKYLQELLDDPQFKD
jgi:hypothetical protein